MALQILDECMAEGARAYELARLLGVGLTTLQRWRRQFAGDGGGVDRRIGSHRHLAHRLSAEERQRILLTCNESEFAALPPGQIVPVLADRGLYIGSERSFYRVLHAHGQAHRRGRARPPQEPRAVPRLRAAGPNQVWSWDITYLPTTVRGIWLYLYLVIDVWSRKVVAWDVAEREDLAIAADLVSRACLKERISKGRKQPLVLQPTTATPCVPRYSRAGWRNWACSGRSHGRASATTTHTLNLCSEQRNTDLITRVDRSPARTRRASG
jgi:transposase InsO family protein